MKKLCCISTVDITLEQFVIPAMKRFRDEGYDVTLVCSMSDEFIGRYGGEFHCIHIPMHRGTNVGDLLKLPLLFYRLFRRERFDYVQYATPNASLYASLGARMARIPRRVYCQWGIRYVGAQGLFRRVLKWFEKLTCSCSTHIRPASWKNLDFAVSEGLYPRSKATVIGDGGTVGVDFSEFDRSRKPADKKLVSEEYPALKGNTVFAFVGRLQKDKGVDELLGAFAGVKEAGRRAALLVIGPKEDGSVAGAPSMDSIVYTGFTRDVPKYLSAADVLVLPSYREGFSMVIQQAMVLGIPVISTDIPGPSEVIEDGKSGILVPVRTTAPLKDAMLALLDDAALRERMGEEGYQRARKHFSRERMLDLTYQDRITILNN